MSPTTEPTSAGESEGPTAEALAETILDLIRRYQSTTSTKDLKNLAEPVVELRSRFRLNDGRVDWTGRSPAYREVISKIYQDAGLAGRELDTFQSTLRYHVGNELRRRAPESERAKVGLITDSPKERRSITSAALTAMAQNAPRGDIPRITAYAQAMLDYAASEAISKLTPMERVASRIALEGCQTRVTALLQAIQEVDQEREKELEAQREARLTPIRARTQTKRKSG